MEDACAVSHRLELVVGIEVANECSLGEIWVFSALAAVAAAFAAARVALWIDVNMGWNCSSLMTI